MHRNDSYLKRSGCNCSSRRSLLMLSRATHGFLAPDVFAEPFVVMLDHRALLLRLVDGVPESFIENQLHRNAAIFQRLIQLVGIRRRHTLILIALLNQRRRLRAAHVSNRRGLAIDFGIVPWS